jgi:hypothetical protein
MEPALPVYPQIPRELVSVVIEDFLVDRPMGDLPQVISYQHRHQISWLFAGLYEADLFASPP